MLGFIPNKINDVINQTSLDSAHQARKLTAGRSVERSSDGAAEHGIASKLKNTAVALQAASRTASTAASILQIADSGLGNIQDLFARMKALAVQASSAHYGNQERALLNVEFENLRSEIARISDDAEFNGKKIFGGYADRVEPPPINFPFSVSDFALVAVVPGRSGPMPDANGNGFAEAGEGAEFDFSFTNNSPGPATNIGINPVTAQTSVAVNSIGSRTYNAGRIGTGVRGQLVANLAPGASVTTNPTQDLDISFRAGTNGVSFDHTFDLYYTAAGVTNTVRLVFGPSIIGGPGVGNIQNGARVSLMSIDGIPASVYGRQPETGAELSLQDRSFSAVVGTDILPTEDRIKFITPYVNLTALDAGLPTANLNTQTSADAAIGIVDNALEAIFRMRADIAGSMARIGDVGEFVSNIALTNTEAETEMTAADIAALITEFTHSNLLLEASINTARKDLQGFRQQSAQFIRMVDGTA